MKKSPHRLFICLLMFFALSSAAKADGQTTMGSSAGTTTQAPACTYSADPQDIRLEWTAYKFTNKTPVKGSFTGSKITGATSAKSLKDLILGLNMDIDTATIESGNPGRNVTLRDFFFQLFQPAFKISAKVARFQGQDSQGKIFIAITMNGVTRTVPFTYTATPEGELSAKAGINILSFGLKSAFDSIHKACEELHRGEDGISKTWPDVDLTLVGTFKKQCPGS